MGIAFDRQVLQVLERLKGACRVDLSFGREPAQHLGYFDIQKMRCMERSLRAQKALGKRSARTCLEKDLDDSRCVEDDHRLSRSAAIAAATDSCRSTLCRFRSRSRISSRVGRSSDLSISRNRYSEMDIPARAARDLSRRCSSSGTFRIWTITAMQRVCSHAPRMSRVTVYHPSIKLSPWPCVNRGETRCGWDGWSLFQSGGTA